MSPLNETFRCGDGEALVTFVYGESSPAEREAITQHAAQCAACAEELTALGSTRQQLAAWTPPHQSLGFRITRATTGPPSEVPVETPAATVLRPAAWWNRPMPAWAQMAAAVLIFASGMAMGGVWSSATTRTAASTAPAAAQAVARAGSTSTSVTQQDLAQLAQQLRGEMAQVRTSAPADIAPADTQAVMRRVSQMIAASETRQMNELDLRTSTLARDWASRRAIDLANIENRLGTTTRRVFSNSQDINSLARRASLPVASPYVP